MKQPKRVPPKKVGTKFQDSKSVVNKFHPKFPFTCNKCRRSYKTEYNLQVHKRKWKKFCNPDIKCQKCDKILYSGLALGKHKCLSIKDKTCSVCSRVFFSKAGLQRHMITHDSKRPKLVCERCGKGYLKSHKCKTTRMSLSMMCALCNKTFPTTRSFFYKHTLRCHERLREGCFHNIKLDQLVECSVCKQDVKAQDYCVHLHQHLECLRARRIGALIGSCSTCDITFFDKEHELAHVQCHLTDELLKGTKYTCKHCGKVFKLLEIHLRKPAHEMKCSGNLKCVFCDKSFSAPCQLKSHIYQHTGERPFHCMYCGEEFISALNRRKHIRKKHPNEKVPGKPSRKQHGKVVKKIKRLGRKNEGLKLKCPHCDRILTTQAGFENHMHTHSYPGEFTCEQCGVGLSTKNEMHTHRRLCKNLASLFNCPLCNSFTTRVREEAINHMLACDSTTDKSILCDKCPKVLPSRDYRCHFCRHILMEKRFKEQFLYPCDDCLLPFPTETSLKMHLPFCDKNMDPPLEYYICPLCDARSYVGRCMKDHCSEVHQIVHKDRVEKHPPSQADTVRDPTGNAFLYKCYVCEMAFRDATDALMHIMDCRGKILRPPGGTICKPIVSRRKLFSLNSKPKRVCIRKKKEDAVCSKCLQTFKCASVALIHESFCV